MFYQLFFRETEFHDLKSINFGDSTGHLLINCPFGMKNLLFKLIQENFLSTEISGVAILDWTLGNFGGLVRILFPWVLELTDPTE